MVEGKSEACEESRKKCLVIDGKKAHVPTTFSFFKVMIGSFSKSLFLPPKFYHRAVALVDQSTLLEDMRGQQWRVKLSKVDGSLAFQQGWDKFVSDHSVKFGEILVFNYIVGSHFLVQIFGTSSLERLNFSIRNNGNHHKGKQTRKRKPSPEFSPSIKMPCYMVDTDAMNEKGATMNELEATGSKTPPCDSSDFEMSESTDKAPTPMEKSSNYASSSRRISDISEIPCYVIDEDSMNEVGAARSRTTLNFEMIGNKCDAETPDKLPTKLGKSADHDSGSKMTPDDEEGAARSKSASLSSCDVEIIGTKCNVVDMQKSVLERSSWYKTRSKRNFDVAEALFHMDGGDSANEERTARSGMAPSNSSDFKMVEGKCDASKSDAGDMENVPRRKENSSHHDGSSKMTCDALQKVFHVIDKDLDGGGDVRSPTRPSSMSNIEVVELKCDAGDREQVPNTEEESSHHQNSCKSSLDASDTPCCLIDGDSINEEGDAFQSKCNAKDVDEVPKSIGESSNYVVSSKMKQEILMKYSGEKNSVHEEAASSSRAVHSNFPESGVIGNKCEDEGMEKVPKTTEKSQDDSSKMNSDASQNPCYMIDEDSASKRGATRCETAPVHFPDIGIIETKCADEKDEVKTTMEESSPFKNSSEDSMNEVGAARSSTTLDFEMIGNKIDAETPDKLLTKLGKSADHDNGSKMALDDEEGAARSRSTSLSSCDVEIIGTKCNVVDMQKSVLERSSWYRTRSKRNFDVAEALFHMDGGDSANEERTARSGMAPSSSSDFKMVESKCDASKPDAEDMENVPRRTENSSHHDGSSKMTCDALQNVFHVIYKDLDGGGDVRSPTRPSCMSNIEVVELKCDAGDREQLPNTEEESSHHENSCKSSFDASDTPCCLIDGDSINEEGAAFQSKCNVEDVDEVPKSIGKSSNYAVSSKMKQEKNSVHEEAASSSRAVHSHFPESGVIGSKRQDEGMEKVPKTTEKSHDDSSKMNSDASQNPCYMIDEDSASKEGVFLQELPTYISSVLTKGRNRF